MSGSAFAKTGTAQAAALRDNGSSTTDVRPHPDISPLASTLFNVAGIQSFFASGAVGNVVVNLPVGANAEIAGVAWNVILSAFSPSWLSEMMVSFENSTRTDGVS